MPEALTAPSAHEAMERLLRPSVSGPPDLHAIVIHQDWAELLERSRPGNENSDEEAEDIQAQALATLVEEIAGLRLRLAISEGRRAQLEQLIDTDPLCPVLNRRAFERELTRAISWSRRTGRGGSVLFLDMNGLKQINDTYGHVTGDRAIARVAKMLVLSCRATDMIGRLGGDEFAVIMPDTPTSGALVRGERVDALLLRLPLVVDEEVTVPLAAAYGAAPYGSGDTAAGVLRQADAAMYAHKKKLKAQC